MDRRGERAKGRNIQTTPKADITHRVSTSDEGKRIEAELRRLVPRLIRTFVKNMAQMPFLTIEVQGQANQSEERIREITAWLFERRC